MAAKDEKSSRGKDKEALRKEVTKNVRGLLLSVQNGLTVAEIQRDYKSMIGKPFPFRELGFNTPLDLLKDLPDVARPSWENGELVLQGIPDATTRHIARLVARQRKSSPRRKTRLTSYQPEQTPVLPHFIRTKIKELLVGYPSGLLGSMFAVAFKRRFGEEIYYNRLGFKSLNHLLEAVPDIVEVERMRGGGFRVYGKHFGTDKSAPDPGNSFPVRTKSDSTGKHHPTSNGNTEGKCSKTNGQSAPSIKAQFDSNSAINKRLQQECIQVLARRPNGIWAARFPIEYKSLHGKELNIKQYGFMSVVEFVAAMPDVVRIERPTKVDWLLLLAEKVEKDYPQANGAVPASPAPIEIHKEPVSPGITGNPLNLPDGVGRGVYFSKITVPACGFLEVSVTHIIDPHHFWVMLIENWPALRDLTEEMKQFYSSQESARYKMPGWFVSVGQACCALYEDGSWYRSLVVGIQSVDSIEVFYVDYGNNARLPLSSLRVLRSQFMKLPAQGLTCKLAHIQPFGGAKEWSPGSTHKFYQLTKNYKQLVALFCGIKEGTMCLCLCDTNAPEDLHINDELVKADYADFVPDKSPQSSSPDGQNHDREAEMQVQQQQQQQAQPQAQPQPAPGLSVLSLEQLYLQQQAVSSFCASSSNCSLLPDFPVSIETSYPLNVASWLNQSSLYTDQLMQTNAQPPQNSSDLHANSHLNADELDFIEEINQELDLDSPNSQYDLLVKRVKITHDYSFHIINFESKPYLTSAEISALLWDSDLLRSMLRQKKKSVAKVVVSCSENKEVFEELIRWNVPGVMDGDEARSYVTLYKFEGLPEILKIFDHHSEDLLPSLVKEIECFKKEGENYWTSKKEEQLCSEGGSSSDDQFSESELGIDEIKLLLQAMQFRRKRILQGLMYGCSTGGSVDELQEVELKIEILQQEIQHKIKNSL